jgi:hypothetical protein
MKKGKNILLMFSVICLGLLLSCFGGSESDDEIPMGGEEDQIVGDWWSDDIDDGIHFDGAGGGYDLSYYSSEYCIDIDDPVIYRYDGTTLTIYEDGDVSTGTLEIGESSATFTDSEDGTSITFEEVTTSGNCD